MEKYTGPSLVGPYWIIQLLASGKARDQPRLIRKTREKMKMLNRRAIGVSALVVLSAAAMFAQSNTGIISGRVTDPSGAVVPDAQITVTHTDTNVSANSVSNSDGLFRIPS